MHGHAEIITMRQARKRPSIVFLNDFRCSTDWAEHADHATVCVAGEVPESLDLRFVIGLMVSITGATEDRAKRLMQACKDAGAETVAAGSPAQIRGYFVPGWGDVWHKNAEA